MCPIFTSNVLGIYQKLCSKVQKYYLRNPVTSLKKARNYPVKLREIKKSAASTEDRTEEPNIINTILYGILNSDDKKIM